jgi:hypothetical protein
MKNSWKLVTLTLSTTIELAQITSAQTPNAATDPRINPQVRVLLAELNKDRQLILGIAAAKTAGNPDWAAEPDPG